MRALATGLHLATLAACGGSDTGGAGTWTATVVLEAPDKLRGGASLAGAAAVPACGPPLSHATSAASTSQGSNDRVILPGPSGQECGNTCSGFERGRNL